ncbi:MAG: hypothetical protein ACAH83_15805 [Alphaproteobacteria bacterium]
MEQNPQKTMSSAELVALFLLMTGFFIALGGGYFLCADFFNDVPPANSSGFIILAIGTVLIIGGSLLKWRLSPPVKKLPLEKPDVSPRNLKMSRRPVACLFVFLFLWVLFDAPVPYLEIKLLPSTHRQMMGEKAWNELLSRREAGGREHESFNNVVPRAQDNTQEVPELND